MNYIYDDLPKPTKIENGYLYEVEGKQYEITHHCQGWTLWYVDENEYPRHWDASRMKPCQLALQSLLATGRLY